MLSRSAWNLNKILIHFGRIRKAVNLAHAATAWNSAAQHFGKGSMNKAVATLYDELNGASASDLRQMRARILGLFGEVETEQDRVHLLSILNVLFNAAVRAVEAEGQDATDLRNAILADKRALVLEEVKGTKHLDDAAELLRILDREVAAGRMQKDYYYRHAKAAAGAISPPPQ